MLRMSLAKVLGSHTSKCTHRRYVTSNIFVVLFFRLFFFYPVIALDAAISTIEQAKARQARTKKSRHKKAADDDAEYNDSSTATSLSAISKPKKKYRFIMSSAFLLCESQLDVSQEESDVKTEKCVSHGITCVLQSRSIFVYRPKVKLETKDLKYADFEPLHDMWLQYVVSLKGKPTPTLRFGAKTPYFFGGFYRLAIPQISYNATTYADKLMRADFHGALIKGSNVSEIVVLL
jgi:hypothetical protein